jgi:hypothetical protein
MFFSIAIFAHNGEKQEQEQEQEQETSNCNGRLLLGAATCMLKFEIRSSIFNIKT